jgi:hypothetical protein
VQRPQRAALMRALALARRAWQLWCICRPLAAPDARLHRRSRPGGECRPAPQVPAGLQWGQGLRLRRRASRGPRALAGYWRACAPQHRLQTAGPAPAAHRRSLPRAQSRRARRRPRRGPRRPTPHSSGTRCASRPSRQTVPASQGQRRTTPTATRRPSAWARAPAPRARSRWWCAARCAPAGCASEGRPSARLWLTELPVTGLCRCCARYCGHTAWSCGNRSAGAQPRALARGFGAATSCWVSGPTPSCRTAWGCCCAGCLRSRACGWRQDCVVVPRLLPVRPLRAA